MVCDLQVGSVEWFYDLFIGLFNEKDCLFCEQFLGGACGIMITVAGNEHGDTSSNPGRDWLHIVGQTRLFSLGEATSLGEGKHWIQTC